MLSSDLLTSVELVVFDFDGVFTDNTVLVSQDGTESVRCWRSDGLGLSRLRQCGIPAVIISTEQNGVVTARADKLKLPCKQGIDDKAEAVLATCREYGVEPARTLFVGNDINDIPAFKSVGIPVGVADCYPEVLDHVVFRTHKPGGYGAVREVCDLIFEARRQTLASAPDAVG